MEPRDRLSKITILHPTQSNLRIISKRLDQQSCIGVNGHSRHWWRTIKPPQRLRLAGVRMPAADEAATTIPLTDYREFIQQARRFSLNMLARWRLFLARHGADSMAEEIQIEGLPVWTTVGNTDGAFEGIAKHVRSG